MKFLYSNEIIKIKNAGLFSGVIVSKFGLIKLSSEFFFIGPSLPLTENVEDQWYKAIYLKNARKGWGCENV